MKKLIYASLSIGLFACESTEKTPAESKPITIENNTEMTSTSIYTLNYETPSGEEKNLSEYKGKLMLVVNTATKCGLTPQFEGLEYLNKTYSDKGLKVLGFPCNQFGGQEPLTNEEMVETCKVNHGVTFELAKKIEVNGANLHPIYSHLKAAQKLDDENDIRWNFEKFLVNKDGVVVKRFAPQVTPLEIEEEIKNLL
ncbi:MAG: glutathione peroxidase [Flavobacteriales bacterium]|nr:glutathione peroxidase [Flavobacteriales bacterium]